MKCLTVAHRAQHVLDKQHMELCNFSIGSTALPGSGFLLFAVPHLQLAGFTYVPFAAQIFVVYNTSKGNTAGMERATTASSAQKSVRPKSCPVITVNSSGLAFVCPLLAASCSVHRQLFSQQGSMQSQSARLPTLAARRCALAVSRCFNSQCSTARIAATVDAASGARQVESVR